MLPVARVRVDGCRSLLGRCNGRSSQRSGAVPSLVTLAGLGLDRVAVAGLMEGRRDGLAWAAPSCELQARARRAASRVLALLAGGQCSRALDARRRPAPERARAARPIGAAPTGAQAKRTDADAERAARSALRPRAPAPDWLPVPPVMLARPWCRFTCPTTSSTSSPSVWQLACRASQRPLWGLLGISVS